MRGVAAPGWDRPSRDRNSGPGTPQKGGQGPQVASVPLSAYNDDLDTEEDFQETPWWEVEIETLKSSLKSLNIQLFQERKQWLAEKTELEKAASSGGYGSGSPSHANGPRSLGAAAGGLSRRTNLERSPALGQDRHAAGSLDRLSLGDSDAGGSTSATSQQVAALQTQLASVTSERDAARQEVTRLKAEAQRWNVERASLEREVEVLQNKVRGGAGLDAEGDELVGQLQEENEALQAELDLIKQSLKNNVLVPRAHMANLPQLSAGGAAGAGGASANNSPGVGKPPLGTGLGASRTGSSVSLGGGGGSGGLTGGTADQAATISRLNAEITRLQADLYILKDECVPVPKAEFGKLKGVHSEKAGVEEQVKALRQELADVNRLNKMLREEIELIKEEHCAITLQEYDELRRAAAEKTALELKLEAQSKYYAQIPKEELESLQAARRQLAGLETKLAAMHAMSAVSADDMARALQAATDDAADLRVKVMEAEAKVSELSREVTAGEGRAQLISELQDKLRTSEAGLQATQMEKSRLQIRIRALEDELEAGKKLLREAQEGSARANRELGTARDTNSGLAQEVSQLSRERGELEARVSSLAADREALTAELVDAKLELARLREMEVLYRKNVVVTKKQLYGLPSQAAATAAEGG